MFILFIVKPKNLKGNYLYLVRSTCVYLGDTTAKFENQFCNMAASRDGVSRTNSAQLILNL